MGVASKAEREHIRRRTAHLIRPPPNTKPKVDEAGEAVMTSTALSQMPTKPTMAANDNKQSSTDEDWFE